MTDDGVDIDSALETAARRTGAAEGQAGPTPATAPVTDPRLAEVAPRSETLEVLESESLDDRIPPRGSGEPEDPPAR